MQDTVQSTRLFGEGVCEGLWLKSIRSPSYPNMRHFGLEMEIFPLDRDTLQPLGLQPGGFSSPDLLGLIHKISSDSKLKIDTHSGLTIGVILASGGNFSLEPGGQVEYSSRPAESYDALFADVQMGLQLLEKAAQGRVVFLATGTHPLTNDDHPLVVPKERYEVMTRYFRAIPGGRGVHMMRHTATVQPNIDIPGGLEDWQDAIHLTWCLTPFVKHLFANSPWFQGKPSQFPSERQAVWPFVDHSRTGIPLSIPFAEDVACAYAKWAKSASVFYVNGLSLSEQPLPGELSFSKWLHEGYKGTVPSLADWEVHLGTLFPDLRLRGFLEVRSVDAQLFEHMFAPMAFFGAAISSHQGRSAFWKVLEGIARTHELMCADRFSAVEKGATFLHLLRETPHHLVFQDKGLQALLIQTAVDQLESESESLAAQSLKSFWNWKSNLADPRSAHSTAMDFVRASVVSNPSEAFARCFVKPVGSSIVEA